MDHVYAAMLGLVQGIAEFLPISSSGHLVIAEALIQESSSTPLPDWLKGMTMNVALHFGTLLSITVVYFKDLLELRKNFRLMGIIVVASVSVAVVGLMFKDQIEALFDSTMAAGCCLLVTAAFLLIAKNGRVARRIWTASRCGRLGSSASSRRSPFSPACRARGVRWLRDLSAD